MLGLLNLPGGWEWVIIVLVVLLLFGARRLPELARALGQGIREFRKSIREVSDEPKDSDSGPSEKSS